MQLAPLQLGFDDYTNKTRDKEIDFIFPNPTVGLYKCVVLLSYKKFLPPDAA